MYAALLSSALTDNLTNAEVGLLEVVEAILWGWGAVIIAVIIIMALFKRALDRDHGGL